MELLIGVAVFVALVLIFGQISLDKPVGSWSDEELVRRLSKYENLLTAQMFASQFDKTKKTMEMITSIKNEIVKRKLKGPGSINL